MTAQAIDLPLLKKLWASGLSALECGEALGLTGDPHQVREAVMQAIEQRPAAPAPKKVKAPRSNLPRNYHERPARAAEDDSPFGEVDRAALTTSETDMAIPVEQRRTLLGSPFGAYPAIEPGQCRWPVGDPEDPGFFFCGAHSGDHTYCSPHRRRARN